MTPRVVAAPGSVQWHRAFLIAVALTVFVFALLAAHWRPLWYDELFTLYVASEPSLVATVRALLGGADTNPPVDYLLRHASIAAFGPSSSAFRLPSAVVYVAGLFAIYAFVRRRTPFLPAAGAFLLPIATASVFFSHEGRAYALLFGSAAAALLAWQRAVDAPGQALRLGVLLAALCLGPYSHYYGVLNFVPVAAGEAWRSYRRQRVDWRIVATIAAACVLTLGLLWFARTTTAMQGTFWAAQFRLADLPGYYRGMLEYAGWTAYVALAAALALAVAGCLRTPRTAWPAIPSHELLAAAVLALTPVSALLLAEFATGALTSKYTIAMVPGIAILAGYLLASAATRLPRAVAGVVALLAISAVGYHARFALEYRGSEPVPADLVRVLQQSSLPVAFDSPHQFLEFVHYAPQLAAGRFVYPMDAATAREVRGFDNDEIALRGLRHIRPLEVAGYGEFTERNRAFLVVYTTQFWPGLVNALQRDGYCLVPVARSGPTTVLRAFPGCSRDPSPSQANGSTRVRRADRTAVPSVELCDDVVHLVAAAEDHRRALVDVGRLHVEDALAGRDQRLAAGLLDQHRHRVRLVHQAQLAARRLLRRRVQEHAALEQDAVHVRDHRTHVT